jgi:hypothetical protein
MGGMIFSTGEMSDRVQAGRVLKFDPILVVEELALVFNE